MSHQLVVPALGESVSEATVARWLKNIGDVVKIDDPLVELETDKVTLEVNAPQAGTIEQISAPQGTIVQVGQTLGAIGAEQNQGQAQPSNRDQESRQNQVYTQKPNQDPVSSSNTSSQSSATSGSFSFGASTQQTSPSVSNDTPTYTPYTSYGPQQQANHTQNNSYYQPSAMPQNVAALREAPSTESYTAAGSDNSQISPILSPAARKMVAENNILPQDIQGSGRDGRVTKQDVQQHQQSTMVPASTPFQPQSGNQAQQPQGQPSPPPPGATSSMSQVTPMPSRQLQSTQVAQPEERVRMTRLRQRIAERLKEAQNTAAMLTTFNEIDMSHVMATRESYREKFEKRFGIKLGFMSFFVKAAVSALKEIPSVNAEIQDDYIIYKNHYDIGVAVSAPQGLVVPVVRDADHLNFAEIENAIGQLGEKARTGKLSMSDLSGGTFTITNGGVFGSLMSTPILNPPQSGILGMHKIQKRPIVVDDRVEIRPMMYVALTYDHRIIDGREAVTFLVRIKENIEDPQRILLGI